MKTCNHCNRGMKEGYFDERNNTAYCSRTCLLSHISESEYDKLNEEWLCYFKVFSENSKKDDIFTNLGDTKKAAELWGITPGAVKHLCQQGKVHAQKFGNSWVIDLTQPAPTIYNQSADHKLNGLRKAVIDFNRAADDNNRAVLFFNKQTLQVWTNVYTIHNSHDPYNDEKCLAIISTSSESKKTSMAEIQKLCHSVLENQSI